MSDTTYITVFSINETDPVTADVHETRIRRFDGTHETLREAAFAWMHKHNKFSTQGDWTILAADAGGERDLHGREWCQVADINCNANYICKGLATP